MTVMERTCVEYHSCEWDTLVADGWTTWVVNNNVAEMIRYIT